VRYPAPDPKNNLRFVVTDLGDEPEAVYQFYCGRWDVENRLKELQHGLEMDRTSCEHFPANQAPAGHDCWTVRGPDVI